MEQEARRRLEDLLDREIEMARGLAATLAAERTALTGDSPDAVELKAAEKLQLIGSIEKLDEERRTLCAAPADPSLGATVAERWQALMRLMASCRTANEVNGHIIRVRQHQVRELIDIVRGSSPLTYGPQGKTSAKAQRALARA
jgi:flagellar biosynthesis/type III secretory pathway chaperone